MESGRKQKTMALLQRYRATNRPRATRSPMLSGFLARPQIVERVLAVTRLSHLFLAASLSRRRRGLEKESGEARAAIPRPPLPPAPARASRHSAGAAILLLWPQPTQNAPSPRSRFFTAPSAAGLSLFLITETTLCEVSRGFWGERQDEIWLHLSEIIVLLDLSTVWERSPQTFVSGLTPLSAGLLLTTGVTCVLGKCPQIISSFVGLIFGLRFWLQSFIPKLAWKFFMFFFR